MEVKTNKIADSTDHDIDLGLAASLAGEGTIEEIWLVALWRASRKSEVGDTVRAVIHKEDLSKTHKAKGRSEPAKNERHITRIYTESILGFSS